MMTSYRQELATELGNILHKKNVNTLFQPIINLNKQKIYAYEGLIRGPSNSILHSPEKLFEAAYRLERLPQLDYLCRNALIRQFKQLSLNGRLFVNVNPETLLSKDFHSGNTLSFAREVGLLPSDIVIELTETYPIEDFSIIENAIEHYRSNGFSIAIDDLGAGYSGLKLWSEMKPDFVKIDRHFICDINKDKIKRQFVESIYEIAHSIGCKVITEGIETADEYLTIRKMGAEFAQGFYFCRPTAIPPVKIDKRYFRLNQRLKSFKSTNTVKDLIKPIPRISPRMNLSDVAEVFSNAPSINSVAIVDNNDPIGIITRAKVMDILAGRFGRALYEKKHIENFINKDILVVDSSLPLETLSRKITSAAEDIHSEEFLIVHEGKFKGKGLLLDLLRRITDLRVELARHANPLTSLPGNVPIQESLQQKLHDNVSFIAIYCDIDHFKPYNDYYGFKQGDEALLALTDILKNNIHHDFGFIGHIGGDDFIVFLDANIDWKKVCQTILTSFHKKMPELYTRDDFQRGHIIATNRQNQQTHFDIMSISLGVLHVHANHKLDHEQIANYATKAKSAAKKIAGCAFSILDLPIKNGKTETYTNYSL